MLANAKINVFIKFSLADQILTRLSVKKNKFLKQTILKISENIYKNTGMELFWKGGIEKNPV